ncbi:MAG TPA: hypothetical protein VGE52_14865, partial [Pirellulales bacterium]
VRERDDGAFTYALDDPYIHLAMAKNFTEHGVWGVTRYEFSSASSSPLWTFLLAGWNVVFGVSDLAPLVLNVACSLAAIGLAYAYLNRRGLSDRALAVGLFAAAFVAPLPALTVSGMEHTLQAVTVFAFALVACRELADGSASGLARPNSGAGRIAALALLAAVVTATRYEGLFVVFVICVLLLRQKKVWQSAAVGAAAWAPITAYGAWSLENGWPFFPVSVLLKRTTAPGFSGEELAETVLTLQKFLVNSFLAILLVVAAAAVLAERRRRRPRWEAVDYSLVLAVATACLHFAFARTGWFFRYEAYLVYWLILLLAGELPWLWAARRREQADAAAPLAPAWTGSFWRIAGVPLVLALLVRGGRSLLLCDDAMGSVYQQPVQSARFLQTYYNDQAVAVNDIGAVCWYGDSRVLDLYGLGSLQVAEAKLAKRFDTAEIERLTTQQGVRVAIVHDHWFTGSQSLPAKWERVGRWEIPLAVTVSAEGVSIYAVEPTERAALVAHLQEFAPRLPRVVQQSGAYVDEAPATVSPASGKAAAPR